MDSNPEEQTRARKGVKRIKLKYFLMYLCESQGFFAGERFAMHIAKSNPEIEYFQFSDLMNEFAEMQQEDQQKLAE